MVVECVANSMPVVAAQHAVFMAHVLHSLPVAAATHANATLTMTRGMDMGLLLAVNRLQAEVFGSAVAKEVFARLTAATKRGRSEAGAAASRHLAGLKMLPVEQCAWW